MKTKLRFFLVPLLLLGFFVLPVAQTGCKTVPDARHVQYATLKATADTADAAVAVAAHLYQNGAITAAQANQVRVLYDTKFQPAYQLAIATAKADLSSAASPDLLALAAQLSNLIVQFQHHSP